MNIRDLEYFNRLVEVKHFSKVAKDFNVSQPTITFAVKRLENEMGAKLLSRHHTSALEVTDAGKQFLKHVQAILRHYDLAHREIKEMAQNKMVIGLPPLIENNYFTPVAKQLKNAGLLSHITTIEEGSATILKDLQKGDIDIALLGMIDTMDQTGIVNEVFDQQPFRVYVSKDNPLANQKAVSFSDLAQHDFIQFKRGFVNNYAFDILSRSNDIQPNVIFRSDEMPTIINMIANNVGIGFFTELIPIENANVVSLPLKDVNAPKFNISIAYRKSHYFDEWQQKVFDCIHDGIEDVSFKE